MSAKTDRAASEGVGALSRVDSATVLDALRIPGTGKVYDLGLELNDRIPSNPTFTPLSLVFTHTPEETGAASPFQYSADTFAGGLHIGTHMDAFIHVQAEDHIFGGADIRESDGRGGFNDAVLARSLSRASSLPQRWRHLTCPSSACRPAGRPGSL